VGLEEGILENRETEAEISLKLSTPVTSVSRTTVNNHSIDVDHQRLDHRLLRRAAVELEDCRDETGRR
jgi:hypothetical protein